MILEDVRAPELVRQAVSGNTLSLVHWIFAAEQCPRIPSTPQIMGIYGTPQSYPPPINKALLRDY